MIEETLITSCTIEAEVSTAFISVPEGCSVVWTIVNPHSEPYQIVVESLPNYSYIFEYTKLDLPPPTSLNNIAPYYSVAHCSS